MCSAALHGCTRTGRDRRRRLLGLELLGIRHQTDQPERGQAPSDAVKTHARCMPGNSPISPSRPPRRPDSATRRCSGGAPAHGGRPQVGACLRAGRRARAGRAPRPARSGSPRRRRRRPPRRPRSAAAARAWAASESGRRRGVWSGRTAGKRRVQPVGGRDRLRAGVLEQLELMMEMVDGPDALALAESPPNARRQHRHP